MSMPAGAAARGTKRRRRQSAEQDVAGCGRRGRDRRRVECYYRQNPGAVKDWCSALAVGDNGDQQAYPQGTRPDDGGRHKKEGRLLGKKVEAVVVDPASNWPLFAEKARDLL